MATPTKALIPASTVSVACLVRYLFQLWINGYGISSTPIGMRLTPTAFWLVWVAPTPASPVKINLIESQRLDWCSRFICATFMGRFKPNRPLRGQLWPRTR